MSFGCPIAKVSGSMLGHPVIDLIVPVAVAFACGVVLEQFRVRQQQRRVRRITDRVLDW